MVGKDLSDRLGQVVTGHLVLDKEPRSCADERFAVIKKDRYFRCDAPRCTNGGFDGQARVGDWLFDENNHERFRASNLIREAVHSGRVGQRGTFVFRDGGRLPTATAPVDYPRIAANQPCQPGQLAKNRLQLWHPGRAPLRPGRHGP